jgi:hypothetical protein
MAITYLLGELTSLVGAVEDLVVEYGEVEGESQPDGVGGLHLALADIKCILEATKSKLLKVSTVLRDQFLSLWNISYTKFSVGERSPICLFSIQWGGWDACISLLQISNAS